jgi:hypothetical protein
MRALSVRQPWAELILSGRKTIETRTWRTSHRGLIAVHAGWIVDEDICAGYGFEPGTLACGGLIGAVEVVDVFEFTPETWQALRDRRLVPDGETGGRVGCGWRIRAAWAARSRCAGCPACSRCRRRSLSSLPMAYPETMHQGHSRR